MIGRPLLFRPIINQDLGNSSIWYFCGTPVSFFRNHPRVAHCLVLRYPCVLLQGQSTSCPRFGFWYPCVLLQGPSTSCPRFAMVSFPVNPTFTQHSLRLPIETASQSELNRAPFCIASGLLEPSHYTHFLSTAHWSHKNF